MQGSDEHFEIKIKYIIKTVFFSTFFIYDKIFLMENSFAKAFTLIELLVVIAIVGILAGVIIVSMSGATDQATFAKAKVFASSMRDSMSNNIVSEWNFDNITDYNTSTYVIGTTSGNIADSWGANNGTAVGNPILVTSNCVSGKCINFNGTSYISTRDIDFTDTNAFSISVWIKIGSSSGRTVICKPDIASGAGSPRYCLDLAGNGVSLRFFGYAVEGVRGALTGGPIINDNKWHHIAGTFDGSTWSVFLDGSKAMSTISAATLSNSDYNLIIGARNVDNSLFNGLIDEVRLYNKALSISQIKQQYYADLQKLYANKGINEQEYQKRLVGLNNYCLFNE